VSTVTEEGHGPGLATRFFVGAAILIVVTVGLSVALASGKAEAVARERIRGELLRVPALFAGWRDSQMSARRGQVHPLVEAKRDRPSHRRRIFGQVIEHGNEIVAMPYFYKRAVGLATLPPALPGNVELLVDSLREFLGFGTQL